MLVSASSIVQSFELDERAAALLEMDELRVAERLRIGDSLGVVGAAILGLVRVRCRYLRAMRRKSGYGEISWIG